MTLEFRAEDEPHQLLRPNFLFYGPPKSGKTTAGVSYPGNVILLNADLPNATRYAKRQAKARGTNVLEVKWPPANEERIVKTFDTMVSVMQAVADQDAAYAKGEPPKDPIAAVQIDPVGNLYARLLEELGKRAISPSLPTYQAVGTHIERFCRALCESPSVSAIIVAHDMPVKDESNGEVERLPNTGTTNPTLGQKLMGMVDIVGYTGVAAPEEGDDKPRYMAQLVSHAGRRGGDRWGVLGDARELDLAEWLEVIKAAEQPDTTTTKKGSK